MSGSGNASLDNLVTVYKCVVDDVVKNVREEFLNEGVETHILEEMKHTWENKILATGAVNRPPKHLPDIPPPSSLTPPLPHGGGGGGGAKGRGKATDSSQQATRSMPPPLAIPSQHPSPIPPPPLHPPSSLLPTLPSTAAASSMAPPPSQPSQSTTPPPPLPPSSTSTPPHPPFTSPLLINTSTSLASSQPGGILIQMPQGHAVIPLPPLPQLLALQHMQRQAAAASQQHQQQQHTQTHTQTQTRVQAQSQTQSQQSQSLQQPRSSLPPSSLPPSSSSATANQSKNVEQTDGTPPPIVVGCLTSSVPNYAHSASALNHTHTRGNFKDGSTLCVARMECGRSPATGMESGRVASPGKATKLPGGGRCDAIGQLDGPTGGSSSDESENDTSDDEELNEADDDDDDPLNADDDIDSDNDGGDLEMDNVVVCQFEKVYRVKSKWKFQLKDGIMHVNGLDYIFHKAIGEAEW